MWSNRSPGAQEARARTGPALCRCSPSQPCSRATARVGHDDGRRALSIEQRLDLRGGRVERAAWCLLAEQRTVHVVAEYPRHLAVDGKDRPRADRSMVL